MKTSNEVLKEIDILFAKYENEIELARKNGNLMDNTVRTYLLHSGNFVKWCHGEFIPGGKNEAKKK